MLSCPQCGAPAQSALPGLPLVTCTSCDALLMVDGENVRNVGDSGRMPFDVSPLQIGTRLTVDGQRGEIVGRERWAWESGSWNEWLLDYGSGKIAWVAEEAGYYMIMGAIDPGADVRKRLSDLGAQAWGVLGESVNFDGTRYTVSDVKKVSCVASEGHLPEAIGADFPRRSLDLRSGDGRALTWQRDAHGSGVWAGRYYRLAELEPAGLRQFDGWTMPRYAGAR